MSTIFAMNLGALLGYVVTNGRRLRATRRYDWAIGGLITIFLFIYSREASITAILRGFLIYFVGFAGPFLLISRGLVTRLDIERFLLRLALGGTLVAVTAIFQGYRHWLVYQTFYNALRVDIPLQSWTLAMRAGLMRTGGAMLDYGAAGVFLVTVVCVMPFLWGRFKPGLNWLVMLILVGGLIAAQLRGAWIAAIVGIIFVLVYRRQYLAAAFIGITGAAAEASILLFASESKLASIAGATDEALGTVTYRKQLLTRGLEQVHAHPLFGQSPQQLVANLPDLVQGQAIVDFVNAHLFIAMAAGLPLFAIWVAAWMAPAVQSWRLRGLPTANADLAGIPAAIVFPTMIVIATTSIIDRNLTWPTIAIALAAPCFALARTSRDALPQARARRRFRSLADPPDPDILGLVPARGPAAGR